MRYKQPFTLYKRGKYYYFKTYTPDGVRTSGTSTGCTSKGQAMQYCNELFLRGSLYHKETTFKEYAEHFFDDDGLFFSDRVKPYSHNTRTGYRVHLSKNIMPYFEKKKLADITTSNLMEFRLKMREHYSLQSVVQIMNVLKLIIDSAYRDRVIVDNPFNYLKKLERVENKRDSFTFEEVCKIYREVDQEYKSFILLLILSGLRLSEALGLQKEKLSQGNGFLYYDVKTQLNKKKIIPVKKDSFRQVPFIPEMVDLIGFNPSRLSTFQNYMREYLSHFERSKERKLSLHSCRHFFATNSKSNGVPDIKVEYLLGHSLRGQKEVYTNFKAEDCLEILDWQKTTFDKITGQI